MRFKSSRFSLNENEAKYFSSITLALSLCCPPVHATSFTFENAYFIYTFSLIVQSKTAEIPNESDSIWRFVRHCLQKLHLLTLETVRFQKTPLFETVFEKPPFSSVFSIVLVWRIGQNISKSMRFLTKTL